MNCFLIVRKYKTLYFEQNIDITFPCFGVFFGGVGVGEGILFSTYQIHQYRNEPRSSGFKSAILATVSCYLNHSHVCGIVIYINLPFKILIFNYKFQISKVFLYIINNHHLCSHPYKESEDTVNK